MCRWEHVTYLCGHIDYRRFSWCHFTRSDPLHQCIGVAVLTRTFKHPRDECPQCMFVNDPEKYHEKEMQRQTAQAMQWPYQQQKYPYQEPTYKHPGEQQQQEFQQYIQRMRQQQQEQQQQQPQQQQQQQQQTQEHQTQQPQQNPQQQR
ncbi:hypothetical protein MMC16_006383 [Acarospora aff. strigata]|nr:hypothetical protein [Acarospora aff. strigata]